MRYFANEKVESASSSTTSKPATSRTLRRMISKMSGTSIPLSSRGSSPSSSGDAELEVTFQELEQRRVDPYVVLMVCDPKRRLGRATFQLDGD